jgi:SAM-dependent methyltransferase
MPADHRLRLNDRESVQQTASYLTHIGRFATTAPLYEQFRPLDPPWVLPHRGAEAGVVEAARPVDLGTGPGLLALGFAPYVGRIVGVDPEPAMREGRAEIARRITGTAPAIASALMDRVQAVLCLARNRNRYATSIHTDLPQMRGGAPL